MALAEVEVEDVSKIWFESEPQPKKQKPSCAADSEEGMHSSSSTSLATGRRREDRDDNDARVARIAAIAVNAVSGGTVPVLRSEMLVDRAVPSSRDDRDDDDVSELVLVPRAGLVRISENLGKASTAVGHAIRMFSSATSAFQHQSQTIANMKDEIDNILNANDGD